MLIAQAGAPRPAALAALMLALTLGACGGGGTRNVPSPTDGTTWTASLLSSLNPPMSGSATVVPTADRDGWLATVTVRTRPSATTALGWRIFSGICNTTGMIVGSAVDYPAIQLEGDGTSRIQTTFEPDAFSSGVHSVRIYASPAVSGAPVACGELRVE